MKGKCAACERELPLEQLIETRFFFICRDEQECIASFSGWADPPTEEEAEVGR